ncbi:MAG: RDD family protein [Candidatus Izemoplasmatales bacterium]|jgi:hypothetical protein|nr:RDD family protein [Candidatus Izemoplasmatales bacterium]
MKAGFFRRLSSSIVDMTIVLGIIYLSFILFGRTIIQNQIDNYDEMNAAYTEIMSIYSQDSRQIDDDYFEAIELAGEDETLKAEAAEERYVQKEILLRQNEIDIAPYTSAINSYYANSTYYFLLIFLVLMLIYSFATKGLTLGRRLMKIRLAGELTPMKLFLHDIAFKYLLIVLFAVINPLFGIMIIMFMFLIDTALIAATRNKNTIRDMISKITVEKTELNY